MSHIHPQDQLMIHKQRHSELQAEAAAHRAVNDRQRPTLDLFSRLARQPRRRATSGTLTSSRRARSHASTRRRQASGKTVITVKP
jgi:hypothetical protein